MTQKRFVSWAAVSSLPQVKKISLSDQLATNKEHIERWEGTLVEELVVPGESRSINFFEEAAKKIEAYAKLEELIAKRAFDVFIYLDRSRLGRKAILSMSVIEKCQEAGIITYATESPPATLEPPESNFHNRIVGAIESVMAQEEVVKINRRHEMGMAARVRSGHFPARIPFGWKAEYITVNDKPVQIVHVDEEAKEIILRIIELYVDKGLSFRSIAQILHSEGVPPPRGERWKKITVDRIVLMAWRYAGFVELNRRSKKRQYIKAKSIWPALITEERGKQIVAERERRAGARRSVESPHLFSQLVWCKKCQRRMQARWQLRLEGSNPPVQAYTENYRCMTDSEPSHAKNQIAAFYIRDSVENAILYAQIEENRQRILADTIDHRPEIEAAIATLIQRLAKLDEAFQRADDMYVLGKMDYERYSRQLENLAFDKEKIATEMANQQAQLEQQVHDEGRAERLMRLAADGMRMLAHEDIAEANSWFRECIKIWINNDSPRRRISIEYV